MASNFNINTDFGMNNFQNSINEYNKVFSDSLNETSKGIDSYNFDEIFNSIGKNNNQTKPLEANAQMFVGLGTINAQKIENLSPVAQMSKDIQNGFTNSLNDLNNTVKSAEDAVETFASGGDISIHEVMISAQKSSLAMQMANQLRSHILNAYTEFKNMGV